MLKSVSGVYKVTNNITGEMYIGCSSNVKRRWKDHVMRYNNSKSKEYAKLLYINMRNYGIENFTVEIIEECSTEFLLEKESYYIDILHTDINGYNQGLSGENHGKAVLTKEDVIDIRTSYKNHDRKKEVYKLYCDKINESGFHKIWNGYSWKKIMPEVFTNENKIFHKYNTGQKGSQNGRKKLEEQDVIRIRTLKAQGKKIKEVFEDYKNKVSYGSFVNTWCGYNWKHVVI